MPSREVSPYNDGSTEKRTFDLAMGAMLFPVYVAGTTAARAAVRLEDGSPTLINRRRYLSPDVEGFDMTKVRSLRVGTFDQDWRVRDEDERVTRVGRVIRPLAIDELAQVKALIKGDVSMVGPRGTELEELEHLLEVFPDAGLVRDWVDTRMLTKPGLIGPNAVQRRLDNEWTAESMRAEIDYVENATIRDDIRIIGSTIVGARTLFTPDR